MKKLIIISLLILSGCLPKGAEELKAERAVKVYLDSLNDHHSCKILSFRHFHSIFDTYEDDPNYDKYKDIPSKLDSIKKHYTPKLRAYIIYVRFQGKDAYGNFGTHTYQCAVDKNLKKCVVGIGVGN